MDAVRLGARGGIGPFVDTVEPVGVAVARLDTIDGHAVIAVWAWLQRDEARRLAMEMNLDLTRSRRPDREANAAVAQPDRPELQIRHISSNGLPRTVPTALVRGAGYASPSFLNRTMPSGGAVMEIEYGRPCQGTSVASMPPRLPCPPPQYSRASLLSTSR